MNKFLIAPSIIASDFIKLGDEITTCESAGACLIQLPVWIVKPRLNYGKTLG
jgi:pentose-5-phosphate-3-epimerase